MAKGPGSLTEFGGENAAVNIMGPNCAGEEIDISTGDAVIENCKRLYVGVGGDVKVDLVGGGTVTYRNVPSGQYILESVSKIYQSGTTAEYIIALKHTGY